MIDPLFDEAKELSQKKGYVSVSYIQRMLRVGYTRAARLVDLMIEQEFCEAKYAEGKGYRALKVCQIPLTADDAETLAKIEDVQSDLFCNIHKCETHLVDYEDGSRYECPECQREDGEQLGLI
jgi:DNA segregation ATPase FtsK/SpoIIIE-like protein